MEVSKSDGIWHNSAARWKSIRVNSGRAVDALLAGIAAAFGLVDLTADWGGNGTSFTWTSALVIVFSSLALLFRRSHTTTVLILIWLARPMVALDVNTEIALSIPAAIALYTFARKSTRRNSLIAAIAASGVAAIVILIVAPDKLVEELVTEVLIALLVSAVAEAVRTNETRTAELVRAKTTERVQAERLRLAHDLHDGIAHSLSNIAVQSGVASRLIDSNPEHAKRALDIINASGRESLDELRSFLGLLRSEDPAIGGSPMAPAQPDDIHQLIGKAVRTGAEVRTVQTGSFPDPSPDAVVRAMCRIVDESLTNVRRHAGNAPTIVEIQHRGDGVDLRITNMPGSSGRQPVPSTGVGIIGMRERAEAVGGRLTAREIDSGFEVRASIPYAYPDSEAL